MNYQIIDKIKRRLWGILVSHTRDSHFYPFMYRSYWHFLLLHKEKAERHKVQKIYYTARPNPGAGVGHQIANWIAGYWYAKQFGLKFAHIPFTKGWDDFLGFGNDEVTVKELTGNGFKLRKLPLFKEKNLKEVELNKRIINSYANKKIIFIAEQDQFYKNQYGVMAEIKQKFFAAPARKNDKSFYSLNHFNIAMHVRRGDIMTDASNSNLTMRYLSNNYFINVLKRVTDNIKTEKPIHIYFFSQGKPDDYPEFGTRPNFHWCFDINEQDSFLHFVYADLLITSKSSFSYKSALLNNGIKICPKDFWHGYPNSQDWILAETDGSFEVEQLAKLFS